MISIIIKKEKSKFFSEEYITALFNSKIMNVYYQLIVQEKEKVFAQVKSVVLKQLPIPQIDDNDSEIIKEKVNEIIKLNSELDKINYISEKNILLNYIQRVECREKLVIKIKENMSFLNNFIYRIYGLTSHQIEIIERIYDGELYNVNEDINVEIESYLSPDKFVYEHVTNNKSIEQISHEFGLKYSFVIDIRERYAKKFADKEPWKFYNIVPLLREIRGNLGGKIINILNKKNRYARIEDLKNDIEANDENFEEIINILRDGNPTKKSIEIIKNTINIYTDSWNVYIKNKIQNKGSKEVIKYYDNNFYGLSEWSDEIHKEYFIYAMKEYTELNPNEKKAKDILKLFEGLNVKDKDDYIDMFNLQIKKAFKK